MHKIIVAGSGTNVGKTIVAAILTTLYQGNYWKPIQCGEENQSDSSRIQQIIDMTQHCVYPSAYSLKAPLSPHHAARLENVSIDLESIIPPSTQKTLIIESVGGIFVPLTHKALSLDLFKSWNCQWILVSRHYLGSINHTLLTIEALKHHQIKIAGLIFNGQPNLDSESIILEIAQLPLLGRLLPEACINLKTIQRYAKQWQRHFLPLL